MDDNESREVQVGPVSGPYEKITGLRHIEKKLQSKSECCLSPEEMVRERNTLHSQQ